MRLTPLLLSCLILVIANSCTGSSKSSQSKDSEKVIVELRPDSDQWSFDTLVFNRRIGINADPSNVGILIDLSLEYPKSAPDSVNLEKIQNAFTNAFLASDSLKVSPTEAFVIQTDQYVKEALVYVEDLQKWSKNGDSPLDLTGYNESLYTRVANREGDFLTLYTATSSYLGGSHGSYFIRYYTIDIATGKILTEADLFKKNVKKKLALLIQDEIDRRNNSPNDEDRIELLIAIEEVESNDNFYLTDSCISYVYNEYEISPYEQGGLRIDLLYNDELFSLMKDKYRLKLENLSAKEQE